MDSGTTDWLAGICQSVNSPILSRDARSSWLAQMIDAFTEALAGAAKATSSLDADVAGLELT